MLQLLRLHSIPVLLFCFCSLVERIACRMMATLAAASVKFVLAALECW